VECQHGAEHSRQGSDFCKPAALDTIAGWPTVNPHDEDHDANSRQIQYRPLTAIPLHVVFNTALLPYRTVSKRLSQDL
jgi:uncharacterized protein YceK